MILDLTNAGDGDKISLKEMNECINALLKQSIKSEGVINLFSDVKKNLGSLILVFRKNLKNKTGEFTG